MKMRKLGLDGPEVSAIGLGCMSFAGFYGETNREESFATLDAARDAGITLLDTAELYGNGLSEQLIGDWQKDRGHSFTIATKGGIVIGGERGQTDNSEPGLRRALEGSLARLGVAHVALYYVHRRQFDLPIEAVTETLEGFRQEGLIGGFGYSEIAPSSLRRATSVAPVMAVQNEYSLWTRYPDLGLIQTCAELGTTFVPFSPLARGMMSEVAPSFEKVQSIGFLKNNPRFLEPNFSANQAQIETLRRFAHGRGWTLPALAIAWTLDQGDHLIPIPGTRTPDHLRDWAEADQINFSADDRAEIARLMPPGWAHGDRYSDAQIVGIERYC
ncbi:aldo/keto reductase [Aliiroseovarius subalbicans]|uniref:aldo/keto reductase n=1 Tax=Aliiroseovarius subalbicans TaxID=2925840 RepID=UPI001F58B5F8|nr:aldo/keto reductase [Aliiroseovarius subalbicans]MCI2400441.1 aldo/keto reductase [Aliiroseovarius subalbicans]